MAWAGVTVPLSSNTSVRRLSDFRRRRLADSTSHDTNNLHFFLIWYGRPQTTSSMALSPLPFEGDYGPALAFCRWPLRCTSVRNRSSRLRSWIWRSSLRLQSSGVGAGASSQSAVGAPGRGEAGGRHAATPECWFAGRRGSAGDGGVDRGHTAAPPLPLWGYGSRPSSGVAGVLHCNAASGRRISS